MPVFYTKDQMDSNAGEIGKLLKVTRDALKLAEKEIESQKDSYSNLFFKSELKNFKFTVVSTDSSSIVDKKITQFFDKDLPSYASSWTLLKNGVFLADSTGLVLPGGSVSLTPTEIVISETSESSYELITHAAYISVEDISLEELNTNKTTIESFGHNLNYCSLKLKGTLKYPQKICKDTEEFKFTTKNSVADTQELPIVLGLLTNEDEVWSLYESGVLQADSSGFSLEDIVVIFNENLDGTTYVEIFLNRNSNNNNYAVKGLAETLVITFNSLIRNSVSEDTLTVLQHSKGIKDYNYDLGNTNLLLND